MALFKNKFEAPPPEASDVDNSTAAPASGLEEPLDFTTAKKGGWEPAEVRQYIFHLMDEHEESLQAVITRLRTTQEEKEKFEKNIARQIETLEEARDHAAAREAEAQDRIEALGAGASSEGIQIAERQATAAIVRVNELEEELAAIRPLAEQAQALQAEVDQLQSALDANTEGAEAADASTDQSSKLQQLEEELISVQAQAADAEALRQRVVGLEAELEQVQGGSESGEIAEQLAKLRIQRDEAERTVGKLQQELAVLQGESGSNAEMEETIQALHTAVSEREATIETLREELVASEEASADQSSLNELVRQLTTEQERSAQYLTRVEELEEQLHQREVSHAQDESQIHQAQTLRRAEERRAEHYRQELEETRGHYNEALREAAQASARAGTLEKELEKLRQERPDIGATAQRMMAALASAREQQEQEMEEAVRKAHEIAQNVKDDASSDAEKIKLGALHELEEVAHRRTELEREAQDRASELIRDLQEQVQNLATQADEHILSARNNEEHIRNVVRQTHELELQELGAQRSNLQREIDTLATHRQTIQDELHRHLEQLDETLLDDESVAPTSGVSDNAEPSDAISPEVDFSDAGASALMGESDPGQSFETETAEYEPPQTPPPPPHLELEPDTNSSAPLSDSESSAGHQLAPEAEAPFTPTPDMELAAESVQVAPLEFQPPNDQEEDIPLDPAATFAPFPAPTESAHPPFPNAEEEIEADFPVVPTAPSEVSSPTPPLPEPVISSDDTIAYDNAPGDSQAVERPSISELAAMSADDDNQPSEAEIEAARHAGIPLPPAPPEPLAFDAPPQFDAPPEFNESSPLPRPIEAPVFEEVEEAPPLQSSPPLPPEPDTEAEPVDDLPFTPSTPPAPSVTDPSRGGSSSSSAQPPPGPRIFDEDD